MTEEELEKEAIAKYKTGSYPQLHPDVRAFVHGFLASAEPREKRIEELEAQIEKMKSDVVRCFGDEFNILVAKLLKEWER